MVSDEHEHPLSWCCARLNVDPVHVDSPKFFPIHACGFAFTSLPFTNGKAKVVTHRTMSDNIKWTYLPIANSTHSLGRFHGLYLRLLWKIMLAHKVDGLDLEYIQKMVWITLEWRKKFIRFCSVFNYSRGMWFLCGHISNQMLIFECDRVRLCG